MILVIGLGSNSRRDFILFFFFLQIQGLWQPRVKQVYWYHFFPTAFAHSYLCYILVILPLFHNFSLLSHLLWWSVIFDVTRARHKDLLLWHKDCNLLKHL